ncbi:DNA ligase D [Allosphingosinicella indica]|uniref:DNA ligase (ATP) n=1 Tax=Allosphingosinicella indica TaxID=941907 RepID=A0A1X7H0W1_9SPHN|nr:DNA ligase D [Allosphingosinicella indica]SMF77900.1 ATP-dependent DNA ligase LigD phosphoesterase module /ATP-dependent DNA ligase LigD polymerase module [Allosphingosinicella indica]
MAKKPDPLETYNRKRDFAKTKEPSGKRARKPGNSFMVQKHDATRLHYDLRLEKDGVLKSWAVTRGPSLDPADKRLAVETEDHPLSYATFEGTIPKGEYGGGTVMLWDRGTWAPIAGKGADDLDEGHLHFTLDGERMKGEWLLVRMKRRPGEKRDNWLLRKVEDEHAGAPDGLTGTYLTSVSTGRTMDEIAKGKDPPRNGEGDHAKHGGGGAASRSSPPPPRAKGARSPSPSRGGFKPPAFRKLQLATLVDAVPGGSAWLHEMKYDGYRCLLSIGGRRAKIFTRSGLDWTDKFPEIAEAAAELEVGSALLDGEIVSLDDRGVTSFSALQQAISEGGRGLTLFLFDALAIDGKDLTKLPNIERKARLASLIGEGKPPAILYAEHVVGAGEKLFDAMCEAGGEGIVSKKADAPYRGARTKSWLKVKCTRRQEFVVMGWTPSDKAGRALRNLLLGVREGKTLRYAGKVGTGFSQAVMTELMAKFDKLGRKTAPAEVPRAEARGARWVTPSLVAEIAFAEFTAENVVRHASFLGLRSDKKADAVTVEKPAALPAADKDDVRISNPDRVIFPDAKITKGALADYYRAVGTLMLPTLSHRPVSLVRCPQGRAKHCFFQKHDAGSFGPHVHAVPIREKDGGKEDYLYVEDVPGILACVQMGSIEFHGWGSRVEAVEMPDRLVFDLDPDEGLGFDAVKKAATDLRRYLDDIGLQTFAMLTGGKGLHVIAPLTPEAKWPAVKDFAQRFALALAEAEPDRFTATMSKAKRKGRIFLDWLRNQRGSTAILPYSARAREGAPIAAPIAWDELADFEGGNAFSVKDAETLLERASSRTLQGWGVADQVLPDV